MRKFLNRDKTAFEKYAVQDAVITLKHAISMEIFNRKCKTLRIPLTLSPIRRNYVFNELSKKKLWETYHTKYKVNTWWWMLMKYNTLRGVCYTRGWYPYELLHC